MKGHGKGDEGRETRLRIRHEFQACAEDPEPAPGAVEGFALGGLARKAAGKRRTGEDAPEAVASACCAVQDFQGGVAEQFRVEEGAGDKKAAITPDKGAPFLEPEPFPPAGEGVGERVPRVRQVGLGGEAQP